MYVRYRTGAVFVLWRFLANCCLAIPSLKRAASNWNIARSRCSYSRRIGDPELPIVEGLGWLPVGNHVLTSRSAKFGLFPGNIVRSQSKHDGAPQDHYAFFISIQRLVSSIAGVDFAFFLRTTAQIRVSVE